MDHVASTQPMAADPPDPSEPLVADLPVLIVDDDAPTLIALERTLRPLEYEIVTVGSADAALAHLERHECSVVVSDFWMPETDGVALLSTVRRRWPDIERLLLTADADVDNLERGINDAGLHRFMRKPWRPETLVTAVQEAVAANRLRRERDVLVQRLHNRSEELSYLNRLLCNRVEAKDRAMVGFRRRWDAALGAFREPILIVGPSLRVEGANPAASEFLGRTTSEIEGLRCHDVLFESPTQCPRCPLRSDATEQVQVRAGSPERVFELRTYVLPGDAPAHMCVLHDVTKRVAFEREAAHMDKILAIGRLASNIAHELNNPLHAISSFAQLAEQKLSSPEKLQRYLQIIREAAARCAEITSTLRNYARRDSATELRPVDLTQICDQALVLFKMVKDRKVVAGTRPQSAAWCRANQTQLHQVLVNLIQNALDASPAGGEVRVSVLVQEESVSLAVDDTGQGIDAEIERHIFEPFFTTKPEGVGTGLGLAIAQSIMSAHGGKLLIGRSDLGGARVEARLPLLKNCNDVLPGPSAKT